MLGLQLLVLIAVMVLRTAPVRVTPNPWFWLLAFVTSYGWLAFSAYAERGVPLVPSVVGNGLAVLSVFILVFSLLSLGRNIGLVPAQRGIVTRGAYSFVRHPIYSGVFVAQLAFILRGYSRLNLSVSAALIVLLMVRSIVEENFLRDDPSYAAYLREVRWRWLPGIV